MNFTTVPLTVIQKQNGSTIKTITTPLRILEAGKDAVRVIAACQEGIFETVLSRLKIKQAKTNLLVNNEEWSAIVASLASTGLDELELPEKFENLVLSGKLISLEQYDTNGELKGDELADEVPQFELSVCSDGLLRVVYGVFKLEFQAMEEKSHTKDYDLLEWVQLQTRMTEDLRVKLREAEERAKEEQEIAKVKEDEIKDMTEDYRSILHDLQDRFFQVLHSKKQRIRELEGNDNSDLDLLNFEYKKRNRDNLNHVNIEDIMLEGAHLEIENKRPRLARKRKAKTETTSETRAKTLKAEITQEEERELDKEESDRTESGESEGENLGDEELDISENDFNEGTTEDSETDETKRAHEEAPEHKLKRRRIDAKSHAQAVPNSQPGSFVQIKSEVPDGVDDLAPTLLKKEDQQDSDATVYSEDDNEVNFGEENEVDQTSDRSEAIRGHSGADDQDDTDYGSD